MRQYLFDEVMFRIAINSNILRNYSDKSGPNNDLVHLIDYEEYKKTKLRCDKLEKELSKYRPEKCDVSGVELRLQR